MAMVEDGANHESPGGLSENLLREVLRTSPLKELLILQMKGIDPQGASGLVRALMWEDPEVSLSLMGSLPDMVNWLLEFFLELGKQLDDLPEPLLGEIIGITGEKIDSGRLEEISRVYRRVLLRFLLQKEVDPDRLGSLVARGVNGTLAGADQVTRVLEERPREMARAMAAALDELDAESVGRLLNRFIVVGNAARRSRKVTVAEQAGIVLSQLNAGEVFTALGGMLKGAVAVGWSFVRWVLRSLNGGFHS